MNRRNVRRMGAGTALALLTSLATGLLDSPAHAATVGTWADLVDVFNHTTDAATVQLAHDITQPPGSPDLAVQPSATITLDLHHHVLTAIAQQPGDAGIGVLTTTPDPNTGQFTAGELIIEDTGFGGAPGALFATGGGTNTARGAGAGIGGNGGTGNGGFSGTVVILGGDVTATGGSATAAATGGAGAGVGGGGGGGGTPGSVGGTASVVRVSNGTLTAQGGSSADGGGAGAGVGGGGGGATGGAGGQGGLPSGPLLLTSIEVTDSGRLVGTGGTSVDGGGGAGIGGGGGGMAGPGGDTTAMIVNLVPPATINGTGGTSTNGGRGAGIGGGGAGTGGTGGAGGQLSAPDGTTVVTSGGGGGPDGAAALPAQLPGAEWRLLLTDTVGGRIPRGRSYTYLVNVRFDGQTFVGQPGFNIVPLADSLTVTLALPRGVFATSATGDRWACSAGRVPQTVTCAWRGTSLPGSGALFGIPTSDTFLPISVKTTVAPWVPAGAVLPAVATLTSGYSSAVTARDTVLVTPRH